MIEIYKSVSDILLNDSDLRVLTDYTDKKGNIRRAYVPEGNWDNLVIYYTQGDVRKADFTSQIRIAPLVVGCYSRESDVLADQIAERVILLLEKADLSISGSIHVYDCSYSSDIISLSYNERLKANQRVIRFLLQVRYDEVVGTSGTPTRKRQN